jgi:hypothetical protein
MEREALNALLEVHGQDVHAPTRDSEIEVGRNALAVVADAVQDAAHVVDEEPSSAWLVDEEHHPRSLAVDIRK